jgi:mannose-6-phosphate isomerase
MMMTQEPVPAAVLGGATTVRKPWGEELVFAAHEGLYVGKVITVRAGHSLSCQYHHEKTETQHWLSGRALVQFGPDLDDLTEVEMGPGMTIHLPAGVVHAITAVTDTVFTEVSTAHTGWRTDVVRLKDSYGREGTQAP